MTTDIEKQFFDTFGIEKKPVYSGSQLYNPFITGYDYPVISDRILLELICITLNTFESFEVNRIMNIDSLKDKILRLLMLAQDDTYSQVQSLFKEG